MKDIPEQEDQRRSAMALMRARLQILRQLDSALETPMALLGLAWLVLMVIDLTRGLTRAGTIATTVIWGAFIVDFLLRFLLAPAKLRFLHRNWLTLVALLLPALRVLRFARLFRALARLRGLQLVRIVGSVNRGMKSLGRTLGRSAFAYVLAMTAMVTLVGAAGMLHFERQVPDGRLNDFWTALWWTAMIVTTMGSEYWPKSPEGRALCLFLAVYAFAVFGYVTGAIATFLVGRDHQPDHHSAQLRKDLAEVSSQIHALREDIERLQSRRGPG